MGASPRFKVYCDRDYIAACHNVTDGLVLAAAHGPGTTVRDGPRVKDTVWREGDEPVSARDSFDGAARIALQRIGILEGQR